MTAKIKTFEVGRTYYTRSAGDHDCIISGTVVKRTAKTVTLDLGPAHGVKTFRPRVYDYGSDGPRETLLPWGNFSMAPMLDATDTTELRPSWDTETAAGEERQAAARKDAERAEALEQFALLEQRELPLN